jgi:hypothetical protein
MGGGGGTSASSNDGAASCQHSDVDWITKVCDLSSAVGPFGGVGRFNVTFSGVPRSSSLLFVMKK